MQKKDFWKGFGTAVVVVLLCSLLWKPLCRMIPWQLLPFEISMSREAKADMIESYLEKYYVDEVDEEALEEMLCVGMMAGVGDKYTYYLSRENMEQYLENTNGNFDGIGIQVYMTQEGEVVIGSVMEGKPAEEAGLLAGDVIIGVDGENMEGKQLSDVAAKIRGEEGTEVTLTVRRTGEAEPLDATMKRVTVEVESVACRMLTEEIGYIFISGFKANTYEQFEACLASLEQEGMRGLILDLRNNPGGLVRSVYQVGDALLPEGTMVYTLDKQGNREDLECDAEYLDIPLALLVNENSASAAEILAGAVKDTGRGTLVGTQTFGKGLVQRLFTLPDGSGLNITVQKYYTPSGTSIHGIGIAPDVEVAAESATLTEIPTEEDTQLQKGLQVMQEKLQ